SVAEREGLVRRQDVVYACVRRLCQAAAEAPARVGRMAAGGWRDEPDHPIQGVLDRPNVAMAYAEFLAHVVAHLKLTGDSYIWKWRSRDGAIVELWPVPTSWVTAVYDRDGRPAGYDVFQGQALAKARVMPRDMLRIWEPDPAHPMKGLAPLQAALRAVQAEEERQDYTVEMLANSRVPGFVLYQPDAWSEEQKSEARATLMAGLGRGRRGSPLFLSGENARIELPAPLRDLDWPGLAGLSETRICACFGVPPILVGLRSGLDAATYSNYEQARRAFYQDTVSPLWTALDAALTRGLLRDEEEPPDLEIYHETGDVRGMREDQESLARRASELFRAGLVTRDEAREIAGLGPLGGAAGRSLLLPAAAIETPVEAVGVEAERPGPDMGGDAGAGL
ncbi:MAG: phage portal protein, partial [Planctomycetota bacterium]|nr:phage portal protein [Planctomycetota bacterium]